MLSSNCEGIRISNLAAESYQYLSKKLDLEHSINALFDSVAVNDPKLLLIKSVMHAAHDIIHPRYEHPT